MATLVVGGIALVAPSASAANSTTLPQSCVHDLQVWATDASNMLTALNNGNIQAMQADANQVDEVPAPSDCAPALSVPDYNGLVVARLYLDVAPSDARLQGGFSSAQEDIFAAQDIISNPQAS